MDSRSPAQASSRLHQVRRIDAPAAAKSVDIAQSAGGPSGQFYGRLSNGDQIR